MRLISCLIICFLVLSIKADEVTEEEVRMAYDSYVEKFKNPGNPTKYALTNVNGFWQTAEISEMFVDAYERFEDDVSKKNMIDIIDSWLDSQGEDWSKNKYNDDIMWACIMLVRTYLHTNIERYLEIAKKNYQVVYDRAWNDLYGGGLIWYQGKTSKNACVNGPGAIASCFLAIATGDDSYYEKADAMVKWLNDVLVQDDGGVWDNIDWDAENEKYKYNTWISTYNQGTYLGACKMLYEHNHNITYLEWAKKAAERATKIEAILNVETNGNDLIGFKGILARWLGKLVTDFDIDSYDEWMANNARSAWENRNSEDLMWTKFGEKTEENIENSTEDNKRTQTAWGCSAAVSWLVNCGAL